MKTARVYKVKGAVVNEISVISTIKMWLNDATNGDYMLTFDKTKKHRSNEQNRLMWVYFTCIAKGWSEMTGRVFTAQEVHDAYCLEFLPKTTPNGNRIPGKTSELTKEEMTEFLNRVQVDALESYGITLLSLTDQLYEEWSRQYINY